MKTIFSTLVLCALFLAGAAAHDRIIPGPEDLGGRLYHAHVEGDCFYRVVKAKGYQCRSHGGAGSSAGLSAMLTRRYTVEGVKESEMEGFLKKLIADHAKEVTECGVRVWSQFAGKMYDKVCFGSIRFIAREGQANEERGMIEISLFAAGGDKCFAIVVYHVAPDPRVGNGPHAKPANGGDGEDDRSQLQTDGLAIPPPASGVWLRQILKPTNRIERRGISSSGIESHGKEQGPMPCKGQQKMPDPAWLGRLLNRTRIGNPNARETAWFPAPGTMIDGARMDRERPDGGKGEIETRYRINPS